MITDKKTTGIPNRGAFSMSQGGAPDGTRGRLQLIKPNQVNNVGRSGPNKINTTALGGTSTLGPSAAAPAVSRAPMSNPVRPRTQMVTPSPTAPAAPSPIPSAPSYANGVITSTPTTPAAPTRAAGLDGGSVEPEVPSAPITAPAPPTEMEQARSAIRGLTPTQIGELLDELASGSLRGI